MERGEGGSEGRRDEATKGGSNGAREMSKGVSKGGAREGVKKGAKEGEKFQRRYPLEDTGQYTVYSARNNPQRGPCP